MNKASFMNSLSERLKEYGVTDTREILLDFEQHFEDGIAAGETEDEVCSKLGDPNEIAKQYIPDMELSDIDKKTETKPAPIPEPVNDGFDTHSYNAVPPPPPVQNQGFQPDAGRIIGIIVIDLFVLSWVLPSLISLIFGLYGCTVGFGTGGILTFIGGIIMNFLDTSTWLFTTFSPLSTTLFGVVLMSLSSLLVIASIAATKGTINIFKRLINWHSEAFIGKKVCKINKKDNTGEAL